MTRTLLVLRVLPTRDEGDDDKRLDGLELAAEVAEHLRQAHVALYFNHDAPIEVLSGLTYSNDDLDHPLYGSWPVRQFQDENPGVEFDAYHLIGGRARQQGVGGYGTIDKSVVFESSRRIMWKHAHEASGHGIGIGHMGSLNLNGTVSEYGGYGWSARDGLLPAAMAYPGKQLIPGSAVELVSQGANRSGILYPIEADPLEIGPHKQFVKILGDDGNEYHLSFRRRAGAFTHHKTANIRLDAYYHRDHPDPGRTKWVELDPLEPGEVDEHSVPGYVVEHLGFDSETVRYNVRPHGQGAAAGPDQQLPFHFAAQALDLDEWAIGNWSNDKLPLTGFDIIVRNGYCTAGWFTYDGGHRPKHRRWFFGQGEVVDGRAVLRLFTTRGGREALEVGTLALHALRGPSGPEFGGDHGELFAQWLTTEHGRGSVRLTRSSRTSADDPRTGHYKWPHLESEGVRVQLFRVPHPNRDGVVLEKCVAIHYGHGPAAPAIAGMPPDPDTTQRWWMIDANRDGDRYSGRLLSFDKGAFQHPMVPEMTDAGSATVRMVDDRLVIETEFAPSEPLVRLHYDRKPH